MSLLTSNRVGYKPFEYPWAYEAWKLQQQSHWMADEVPLTEDVKDWRTKLTDRERNLLTQIFRFFTQADVDVNDCYMTKYASVFKPTEVKMMLSAFSNMETVHIDAYSQLMDTIGMPEVEYSKFMEYKAMKDKHEFGGQFNPQWADVYGDVDFEEILLETLAVFGAFTEGLQLFASFAILMNFPRFNKMRGMGQIISWSIRDESLHAASTIRLYHTLLEEYPSVDRSALNVRLVQHLHKIVDTEDAFIDIAFEMGAVEGLRADEVKQYVRYIADKRCRELGLPVQFHVKDNPLPWMDEMVNGMEFTNFFENKPTEYSKATTKGNWDDEAFNF